MSRPLSLAWWHADSGVTPDLYTRDPWTLFGTGVSLVDERLRMVDSSAVDRLVYTRNIVAGDSSITAPRDREWVWFQLTIKGITSAPAWAGGASPIGFYIDDGGRSLGVSVGSTLRLIDPYSGAEIATVASNFPWTGEHVFMLVKCGHERWELWVDGRLLFTAGYLAGVVSPAGPPVVGFGCLDPTGQASADFNQPEVGVNLAVPPQWKVERWVSNMPIAIQNRWSETCRAAARATVGLLETPLRLLEEAWRDLTAQRIAEETYAFTGERLPSLEVPAWTLLTSGSLSIQRQRLRIAAAGAATTGVRADVPLPAAGLPTDVEYALRATWTIQSYTADANGRVGPHMQALTGDARVTLQLVEVVAGAQWAWVFTNDQLVGAYANVGTVTWLVDIYQPHEVEIQVLGHDWVLLIVDKRIVDRVPYSAFTVGAPSYFFQLASAGPAGAVGTYTLENVSAERRMCDLSKRAVFLQNAVERLIFVGGCERNDEIETWMQHEHEVQQLRGTTTGIQIELRRLSCSQQAYVVADQDPAQWYLEVTYPEVTPIYLEATGYFTNVYVEFPASSINFSPTELADLAAFYLVPQSVTEYEYFLCLATVLTANAANVGANTRLTVVSTEGFVIGDTVTIRNAANTVDETRTVVSILSATSMDITQVAVVGNYLTNSVVRKTLRTS